jgi:hypothetical protein
MRGKTSNEKSLSSENEGVRTPLLHKREAKEEPSLRRLA